jgi:hypothetical protein
MHSFCPRDMVSFERHLLRCCFTFIKVRLDAISSSSKAGVRLSKPCLNAHE